MEMYARIRILRYDISYPQAGKDVCDRVIYRHS